MTGMDNGVRRAPRVLQVSARYYPYMGGVETHIYEVARRMAQAGVDVTVLTTDPAGKLPAREEHAGVKVRRVPAWPAWSSNAQAPPRRTMPPAQRQRPAAQP